MAENLAKRPKPTDSRSEQTPNRINLKKFTPRQLMKTKDRKNLEGSEGETTFYQYGKPF